MITKKTLQRRSLLKHLLGQIINIFGSIDSVMEEIPHKNCSAYRKLNSQKNVLVDYITHYRYNGSASIHVEYRHLDGNLYEIQISKRKKNKSNQIG